MTTGKDIVAALATAIWERDPDMDAPSHAVEKAEGIIAALLAEGFVIVPVEASEGMICAGIIERHDAGVPEAWSLATANIYRAMIAARPQIGGA